MSPTRSLKIPAAVVSVAAAGVLAAVFFTQTNCTSSCGSNCPNATVYIGNLDNQQLAINDILMSGPACPADYGAFCAGDGVSTNCTHVTVTGRAEGTCDVLIVFNDRPAEIVHTQFGPPIMQGCCKGYTIVGDSVFVIPANPDAGISGADGGTDAVTIVSDAATSDATPDASGDTD